MDKDFSAPLIFSGDLLLNDRRRNRLVSMIRGAHSLILDSLAEMDESSSDSAAWGNLEAAASQLILALGRLRSRLED